MRHGQKIGTVVPSHVPSEGVDAKMKEEDGFQHPA